MKYMIYLLLLTMNWFFIASSVNAAEGLILGVHPYKSVKKLQSYYLPLTKLLSKELNLNVSLNIAKDYKTHIDHIGKDKIDIAYMGPASYVAMVNQYGKKRTLARLIINGKPTFKGHIIVRNDSKLTEYSDLINKKIAYGDPNSTMSHLVPRYMLIKNGITKNRLKSISFLGSHDNVAIAVLTGAYDAGAVKEAVYYKYKNKGIKSLAATPDLSEHLFIVSNKCSDKTVDNIKRIFLNLANSDEGKKVLKGIKNSMTGLGAVEDKDYDNLRKILDLLKKKKIIK